jgi:hypothetical protein
MAYLAVNESFKTAIEQIASIPGRIFGGNKFKQKKAYFEKYYDMKPVNRELASFIRSRCPGAAKFNSNTLDDTFSQRYEEKSTMYVDCNGVMIPVPVTNVETGQSKMHDRAVMGSNFNGMGNATTYYPIPINGKDFYVVYFTFDSNKIKSVQCWMGNSSGKISGKTMNLRSLGHEALMIANKAKKY